jgi:hypothetical protein
MTRLDKVEGLVLCKRGGGSSPLAANGGLLRICDVFVIAYKAAVKQVVTNPNNFPNAFRPLNPDCFAM